MRLLIGFSLFLMASCCSLEKSGSESVYYQGKIFLEKKDVQYGISVYSNNGIFFTEKKSEMKKNQTPYSVDNEGNYYAHGLTKDFNSCDTYEGAVINGELGILFEVSGGKSVFVVFSEEEQKEFGIVPDESGRVPGYLPGAFKLPDIKIDFENGTYSIIK